MQTWRGVPVLVAWPAKRKKGLSPKMQAAADRFRQVNQAIKASDAKIQAYAVELSSGTQMLPRDLQMQALYGRMCTFLLQDQTRRYSVAAHNDVSEVLDALGFAKGDILIRGETWWMVIPAGTPGNVLTYTGEDTPAAWLPPSGGGSGGGFSGATSFGLSGANSDAFATKGIIIQPDQDIEITHLLWNMGSSAGTGENRGVVARMNGSGLGDTVAEILGVTQSLVMTNAYQTYRLPLGAPAECSAGDLIFIGTTRVNVSGTQPCRLGYMGDPLNLFQVNAPANTIRTMVQIASSDLAPGDAIGDLDATFATVWCEGVVSTT